MRLLALVLIGLFLVSPVSFAQQPSMLLAPAGASGNRVTHPLSDAAHREAMRLTAGAAQQGSPRPSTSRAIKIGAAVGLGIGALAVAPAMCQAWGGCAGEGVHPALAVALFGGIGAGVGAAIGYVVSR